MLDWRHISIGECTSLMDVAREILKSRSSGFPPLTLRCTFQTAGRGQRGRSWHSRPGSNLLMVQILENRLFRAPKMASLAAGIAICETLLDCGLKASLRWPNDIFADGRKLGGILVEEFKSSLLVGTGLNIADPASPDILLDGCRRTSIMASLGRSPGQEEILGGYCRRLEGAIRLSPARLARTFRTLALFGERIFLDGKRTPATTLDIGEEGELIVRKDDGTLKSVGSSGEISR